MGKMGQKWAKIAKITKNGQKWPKNSKNEQKSLKRQKDLSIGVPRGKKRPKILKKGSKGV